MCRRYRRPIFHPAPPRRPLARPPTRCRCLAAKRGGVNRFAERACRLDLSRLHADLLPGVDDRLLLDAVRSKAMSGIGDGPPGECRESRRRAEASIADRVVPDLSGLNPCVAAERGCDEIEGMIGDAGIYMDTAIVLCGMDKVVHMGGLRVFAEQIIIESRAWGFHRPQRLALFGEKPLADQPIGFAGRLLHHVLFDKGAKD